MTDTDTRNGGPWTGKPLLSVYDVDRIPVRCLGDAHHGDARLIIEVDGGEIVLWARPDQGHAELAAAFVVAAGEILDHLDAAGAETLNAAVEQLAARLTDVTPVPYRPAAAVAS